MLAWRRWTILWSLWSCALLPTPTPPARVAGGQLRGRMARDGSHVRYLGIPYATVPKRFQAAQPNPQWSGVLDAQDEHRRCPQRLFSGVVGHEDCLHLNVYTPLPTSRLTRLPVMVYVHGGGFREGAGSPFLYGPEYLVHHNVILVTFNYRLEILGFLCLGIEEAPGNMGLKDQVLALRWVKENIEAFGGDPDNVTLFGESAGAASVMYHLMSPMSRGLFKRAIMQSGSAISPWAFQYEPLKTASLFAKQIGHNTVDPKKLYDIFMTKTAHELLTTRVPRKEGEIVQSENIFVPCLEKELPGVERFLTDLPYNLISRGEYTRVPLVVGFNNEEGLTFFGKENSTTIPKIDFFAALPRDLEFPSEKEALRTAAELKRIYLEDKSDKKLQLARFEGDLGITFPVISTTELFVKTNEQPVYAYRLSHNGWLNVAKLASGFACTPGVTHADDLFYLFKPEVPLLPALLETNMIRIMTTLWTNFAKFGDPTPANTGLPWRWHPTTRKDPRLLDIKEQVTRAPLWDQQLMLYWNATYAKYRRKV